MMRMAIRGTPAATNGSRALLTWAAAVRRSSKHKSSATAFGCAALFLLSGCSGVQFPAMEDQSPAQNEPDAAVASSLSPTAPREASEDEGGANTPGFNAYQSALAPLPPGTAIDISGDRPIPGTSFNFQVCTAAWSFQLEDGRTFAVTASHCARPGEKVWAGAADGQFRYPADPIGEVVYSDFYAQPTHHLDVAFIELYRDGEYVTPRWMETTVASSLGEMPGQVCKLGRSTGETCGVVNRDAQLGRLKSGQEEMESTAASALVCATTGDSGGPVFAQFGQRPVIIGLVSGTSRHLDAGENCGVDTGIEMSFTPSSDIDALIRRVLGTPAAPG